MQKILSIKYLLLTIFFASTGVFPLLHPGLPPTHDGEYHVIRFYEFDKAFRDGDWYPRWAANLNNEYGVPLFNFVYPLPNYVSVLFHIVGFNFIDGFKLSLFFATIIGAVFFYLWSRVFWGELGGLIAATFYSFAPYRFVDIYVRRSVGEVWALAWFPAFLWAVTLFISTKRRKYFVLSSLFFALIVFSHNILAVMFAMFSFTYVMFLMWHKKHRQIFRIVSVYVVGSLVSAIFWLPALLETKYVQGLQIYNIDRGFPELYQLLIPSWGTGFAGSMNNEMSLQIGVANLIVILISIAMLIFPKRFAPHPKDWGQLQTFFLLWFLIVFFLMLSVSKQLWHILPFFDYFQFPWRLLSLMILICSFIAGGVIAGIKNRIVKIVGSVTLLCLTVLLSIGYTKPAYYHDRTDEHYISRDNFIHGTNSPGNTFNTKWMDLAPTITNTKLITNNKVTIVTEEIKTSYYRFKVIAERPVIVMVNTAYFPGWEVFVDNKEVATKITKQGLFSFPVPKGKHVIEVVFNDTMIRKVGGVLSGVGLIAVFFILFNLSTRTLDLTLPSPKRRGKASV